MQDRLAGLGGRVDEGVGAVWATATRATDIDVTLAGIGPERVTDQYKDAKRTGADPELVEALSARFTRSSASSTRSTTPTSASGSSTPGSTPRWCGRRRWRCRPRATGSTTVSAELDGVVGDLTALRSALDELADSAARAGRAWRPRQPKSKMSSRNDRFFFLR